ncbi:S26 family signal peptidase [Streptosporangium sp. NPDC003464]
MLGLIGMVLFGGVVLIRRRFLLVTVTGRSMEPALAPGDRVLTMRRPRNALRHGDIVVVQPRSMSARPRARVLRLLDGKPPNIIKRIGALPGDPVPEVALEAAGDATVPAGKLLIFGDNPSASHDSRDFGFVDIRSVVSVVQRKVGSAGVP